ncbi:STM4015 family protein [Actinomadura rifamycini]|uniref:STM4015 family protein n=1 Tax=Actinomadura rifamycini TaxID=31962 RepID=UPI00040B2EDD|nr:STM4015 family protein [Actinomadura rifamycini]
MSYLDRLEHYAGLPVVSFDPEAADPAGAAPAGEVAWRVEGDDGGKYDNAFAAFAALVDPAQVVAVILGGYSDDTPLAASSLAGAASYPRLRTLFVGDLMSGVPISWVEHENEEDFASVFRAFPSLERFELRGATLLDLDPFESASLKMLRFESGGLPAGVVRSVGASDLPNLEHLDLWLGTPDYGGDASVDDLAPILSGERLPALRHLGLEDSEIQDEVAEAVASAPVVARLESLSLAMGTLSDRGAEALLAGQPLTHLRKLDLHHHFLSEAMMERVRAALPGVDVDLGDRQVADDFERFYIRVSE